VVQAVGRVLRRAEGKDLGYIVVPVPVTGQDEQAAVTASGYAPVWDVLAALADHDDVLADQIEQARRTLGRAGHVDLNGSGRIRVDVPGANAADLVGGIWLQAVQRIGSGWAYGLGVLEGYVAREGHARVPSKHRTDDGYPLGTWVENRRRERKEGRLTAERIAALDGLGFVWDPLTEDFDRGLAALKGFVDEEGHARVPRRHRNREGFSLGSWVSNRRQFRNRGWLTDDQIAALDALGFVWDPFSEEFARGLGALEAFVAESKHGRVPRAHRAADGFALGSW
jgi:hypothetical protein